MSFLIIFCLLAVILGTYFGGHFILSLPDRSPAVRRWLKAKCKRAMANPWRYVAFAMYSWLTSVLLIVVHFGGAAIGRPIEGLWLPLLLLLATLMVNLFYIVAVLAYAAESGSGTPRGASTGT